MSQAPAHRELSASADQIKCANCRAPIEFDPGSGALKCAYCGHVEPIRSEGRIVEYDLSEARDPRHRTRGISVRHVRCGHCNAQLALAPGVKAARCPFCDSAQVTESTEETVVPESLVPLAIPQQRAEEIFTKWVHGLWFRPSDLRKKARLHEMKGVYLPFWTYDAAAYSSWVAESGYYYYETETYTTQENGQTVTKTRQVQKVRWVPSSGSRHDSYDDWLVFASRGLPRRLVEQVYPFRTESLVPYAHEYLAGWMAEEAAFGADEGWTVAREGLDSEQESRCARDVPGDTHRGLQVSTRYSDVAFKHALLPLFVCAYTYQSKTFRFLVNGQTGKASGEAPWSWIKITIAVVFALILIAVIAYFAQ